MLASSMFTAHSFASPYGTHQLWQITDEVVMMGLVTVQGQSVMVRVVA